MTEQRTPDAEAEISGLLRLRRVTWWGAIQFGLLVLATLAIFTGLSHIDWPELWHDLEDAAWGWIALGFVVAQLPRLTQAVSTLGSVPARLPYGPVYLKELTTSYLNVAMPSMVGRMTVSVRFFQCLGLPPVTAVTAGAIDSLAGTVVQVVLLVGLLLFSQATLDLHFTVPETESLRLLWILVGLTVGTIVVLVSVGRIRHAIVARLREWWPQVRASLAALRASHKLALLFGGSLATDLLFALALGCMARGLGADISLADLLVINISVSLLASFLPVPGGVGVVEFGLTVGLTSAGMDQEAALAAVILYRLSTFYLPPTWGFFAMRRLKATGYL